MSDNTLERTKIDSAKEILLGMSKLSDNVIDASITPRLAMLADKPDSYELERIIDVCVYGSLCSDTVILIMKSVRDMLKSEIYK